MGIAGWLFADLLLGLSMIFLIATSVRAKPTPTPTTIPSPTLTMTVTPTSSPTATITPSPKPEGTLVTPIPTSTKLGPIGLSSAQCYNLSLSSNSVLEQKHSISYQLKSQIPNDKNIQAGLVLLWVHGKDMWEGVRMAGQIKDVVKEYFPNSFEDSTAFKSLYFETGDLYHTQLEIYFFTNSPWISGREVQCEYVK